MTIRKTATDNGFIVFKDQLSLLKLIPDEQLGQAIKLLLEHFDDLPEMNNIAYEMIATNVRRYREQSLKAKENGLKGGNPTLKGVDKGADNPTLKLQDKTRQEKNIKEKETIVSDVKKVKIEQGKFFMDDTIPEYKEALQGMSDKEIEKLWSWIMNKYGGQELPMDRITKMIKNFNKREAA